MPLGTSRSLAELNQISSSKATTCAHRHDYDIDQQHLPVPALDPPRASQSVTAGCTHDGAPCTAARDFRFWHCAR